MRCPLSLNTHFTDASWNEKAARLKWIQNIDWPKHSSSLRWRQIKCDAMPYRCIHIFNFIELHIFSFLAPFDRHAEQILLLFCLFSLRRRSFAGPHLCSQFSVSDGRRNVHLHELTLVFNAAIIWFHRVGRCPTKVMFHAIHVNRYVAITPHFVQFVHALISRQWFALQIWFLLASSPSLSTLPRFFALFLFKFLYASLASDIDNLLPTQSLSQRPMTSIPMVGRQLPMPTPHDVDAISKVPPRLQLFVVRNPWNTLLLLQRGCKSCCEFCCAHSIAVRS